MTRTDHTIPERVRLRAEQTSPQTRQWLKDLPGLLAELEQAWELNIGQPLSNLDLHTTREVALAKVLSTLSERGKQRAAEIQERLHVDPTGWNFPVDEVPHLRVVQDAVWQNHRLSLVYRQESGNIMTPLVDPLGLVVKAGIWYLIGATHETIRPFRIARIQHIDVLQETFSRPEGFHLAQYWTEWCTRFLPADGLLTRYNSEARDPLAESSFH